MTPLERRVLLSGDPYVVDLLAVYTPQAKTNRGGDVAIQSLIQSAVDATNQALYDSLIPVTIRLVHAEEIAYTTSGDLSTDEDRLQNPADGFMDSVHGLRDTSGADLVALITNDAGSGGIAHGPLLGFEHNDRQAFTTMNENSINVGNLTMAHELGHLLGAGHERNNPTAPADGIFPYSYGYRFTGADGLVYHDIMSYDPGLEIPRYANPAITYAGVPEGKPDGDAASADLAKTFMLTAPMVAGYRATAGADTTPPRARLTELRPGDQNRLTFTVRYIDDSAVDAGTIGSDDVFVRTPEGFDLSAELVAIDDPANAFAKVATYRVTLPDTQPPLSSLQFFVRAGEVRDVNANALAAGAIIANAQDLAGSNFRMARDLGTLDARRIMPDSLSAGDIEDIYRFTLPAAQIVNVSLTGLTGAADFFFVKDKDNDGVYDPTADPNDPTNEYLGGSFGTTAADRSYSLALGPGTYYLWTFLRTQVSTATTPYVITFDAYTDTTPPTATADSIEVTTAGAPYADFAVTYTDDHEMDTVSTRFIAAVNVHAELDSGFSFDFFYYPDPDLNAVAPAQNPKSDTVFFRVFGPANGFTAADNGLYTLTPRNVDRATDAAGNLLPVSVLGSYRIAIGTPDTTPPTAAATLKPIIVPSATYDFVVAYTDNRGIAPLTIDGNEIRVTGPHGFNQVASLVGPAPLSPGGSTRLATYRITAPASSWRWEDDGAYSVELLADSVADVSGLPALAKLLGTIDVHVPYAGDANGDDAVDFNDLVALAQNYNTVGKGLHDGDANFDGRVDFNDLVALAQRYNTSRPPTAVATATAPILSAVTASAPPALPAVKSTTAPKQKLKPVFATTPMKTVKPPAPRRPFAAAPTVRRKPSDLLL